jgi:hypothetical protein
MGLRMGQLLGGLIHQLSTLAAGATRARNIWERTVVGEYPHGVDGKSNGIGACVSCS